MYAGMVYSVLPLHGPPWGECHHSAILLGRGSWVVSSWLPLVGITKIILLPAASEHIEVSLSSIQSESTGS
jgi:hypothetical protein